MFDIGLRNILKILIGYDKPRIISKGNLCRDISENGEVIKDPKRVIEIALANSSLFGVFLTNIFWEESSLLLILF